MIKQKSIVLNFILNAILNMSAFIFPLITFPYVSRVLQPEGTGKIAFAISLVSYFAMIAQLGIPTYGIRTCAKVRDNRLELSKNVQEIFIINLIMSLFAYILFFIAMAFVPSLQKDRTLYLIISLSILFNALGMEWLYKALEQYAYITIRSISFKLIALIATFLLIHQKGDYIIYGAITIFAASASNILNFINVRKHIIFKPMGNYDFKRHIKPVFVFFAMSIAVTIYTNLDAVMLGFMKTTEDVGYYSTAIKVKIILLSALTSLGTVLLPRASYYVQHNQMERFTQITTKAIRIIIMTAVPLTLFFILFAKESILVLAGSLYSQAILPMQIIMPTLLLVGLTNIWGIQILIPLGKENWVLYSEIAGAAVNLALNIILIPKFASSGSAIGTLVAETIVFIVQFYVLRDRVLSVFLSLSYWKLIAALFPCCFVSILLKTLNLGSFVTLILSSTLYFLIYILILNILRDPFILEVEKQALEKLKSILQKMKQSRKKKYDEKI